uniref:RRM domain-containing protein n=1 Tax=Ditylenchus dipsaci TaxID=166011 RepID=A0A915DHK4_9BILA
MDVIKPNNTLYIRNLSDKVKKDELKEALYVLFSQFGQILQILAFKSAKMRGQAHVIFKLVNSSSSAMASMQGALFYGKQMRIQYAKDDSKVIAEAKGVMRLSKVVGSKDKVKPESKKPMGMPEAVAQAMTSSLTVAKQEVDKELPNKILFVSKLPDDADLEVLNSVFQPFAGFKEVRLVPNRTDIAFVEFESEADSAAVRKALNNFQIKPAHRITVAYAMK